MGYISLTLFLVCFALLAIQAVFRRNYFSPGVLYILSISGTLGIAFIPVDSAMTPFHALTWLVIGGSSLAFLAGTLAARAHLIALGISIRQDQPLQEQVSREFRGYRWGVHLIITSAGMMTFVAAAITLLIKYGTVTILHKNVQKIMSFGGMDIGYWQFPLVLYSIWLMLLFPAMFKKLNPSFWLRLYSRLSFFLLLIAGFAFFPARNPLMHMIIFCAVFFNAVIFRLKIKHLLVGITVIFVLFMAAASAKQQVSGFNLLAKDVWRYPYIYIANNYWNLDYALNPSVNQAVHPTTFGHRIIGGLFLFDLWPDWSAIGKAFHFDTMMNESVQKIKGLNTLGYWWGLYKDFWMFGVVILPFLGGCLQGWFYNRIRIRPNMRHLMVHSYITVFIVLAFFADFWALLTTPATLIPLWITATLSTPKS